MDILMSLRGLQGRGNLKPKWVLLDCVVATLLAMTTFANAVEIELISQPLDISGQASQDSRFPSLSRDGRYIAFASNESLLLSDSNEARDIYVFDRQEKIMELIPSPIPGNWNSGPCIGKKGRYVAFHSYPESVAKGIPPRVSDVYIYSRIKNSNELITKNPDNIAHNGEALFPIIGGNKRHVLFTSNGIDLIGNQKSAVRAVYLYDARKDQIELLSRAISGEPANRPSGAPVMSDSGRYVAYKSAATNLVEPRPLSDLSNHIYLLDHKKRIQIQVDDARFGFDEDQWLAGKFDMDERGEFIVFEGRSREIGAAEDGLENTNLFLFNRNQKRITLVTPTEFLGRAHSPSISGSGRYLVFVVRDKQHMLVVWDRKEDRWEILATGEIQDPTISSNGAVLAFESENLQDFDNVKRGVRNVFVVTNPLWQ